MHSLQSQLITGGYKVKNLSRKKSKSVFRSGIVRRADDNDYNNMNIEDYIQFDSI